MHAPSDFADGGPLRRGKAEPREPVVWRQGLQWQISGAMRGRVGEERRVPGSRTAVQRQERRAVDDGIELGIVADGREGMEELRERFKGCCHDMAWLLPPPSTTLLNFPKRNLFETGLHFS